MARIRRVGLEEVEEEGVKDSKLAILKKFIYLSLLTLPH